MFFLRRRAPSLQGKVKKYPYAKGYQKEDEDFPTQEESVYLKLDETDEYIHLILKEEVIR